jgi:polyhydroxybutyrate depolymerase
MMAYRMACEMSNRILAIGCVGGTMALTPGSCNPEFTVSVLHIHGTEDPIVRPQGGSVLGGFGGTVLSVNQTMAEWKAINECTGSDEVIRTVGAAEFTSMGNCPDGGQVIRCLIDGMGHQWPGAEPSAPEIFGPPNNDISATREIVNFFRGFL